MTTKELVQWVLDAEAYHEEHWETQVGCGKTTESKFTRKSLEVSSPHINNKGTSSTPPTQAEWQIATLLFRDYWNDCQGWINEF